jgi:chaperonin GroES
VKPVDTERAPRLELEDPLNLKELADKPNIADMLPDDYLATLGSVCVQEYQADKSTRSDWETKTKKAMELALQIVSEKTYPWTGASNVKFPLLTIAALQYHARAYPALISPNDIVRYQVFGPDPDGARNKQGAKIAAHMTYQLTEEDSAWEENMDKALIVQCIVGCAFKKTYYDSLRGHNVSDIVMPDDLVVSYYTKSLSDDTRISHLIRLSSNQVYERRVKGLFLDIDLAPVPLTSENSQLQQAKDKNQGMQPPANTGSDTDLPLEFIEQHRCLDLDGDGYREPYVVTVHLGTQKVVRVVARFIDADIVWMDEVMKDKVLRIKAENYFVKFPFIPSPDGGFYDIGLGSLLYPINESINTLVNQLIDAGTLSNTGGGFLGKGIRSKSGEMYFRPGEWKRIESTGDDLSKNIVPLPIREPSAVLFKLLDLLIGYGERIGGATDLNVGVTPGQNTPAETSRNAMESGLKVLNGIIKRNYRSLKDEFQKLYTLNKYFLPDEPTGPFQMTNKDYSADPSGIRPAADPNVMSDSQRLARAQTVLTMATASPGFNIYEANRRALEALKEPNIDALLPDPKGPNAIQPRPDPKLMKEQTAQQKVALQAQQGQQKMQDNKVKLAMQVLETLEGIKETESKIALNIAQAGGIKSGHDIALLEMELSIRNRRMDDLKDMMSLMNQLGQQQHDRAIDIGNLAIDASGLGAVEGNAADKGADSTPAK